MILPAAQSDKNLTGINPDESIIAAYEQALRQGQPPSLTEFVPPRDVAHRLATLVELVRTDLEWRRRHGTPKIAAAYLDEFPELANADAAVAAIAFEEYRVRLGLGEEVRRDDYQARYQVSTNAWPDSDVYAAENASPAKSTVNNGTLHQDVDPVLTEERPSKYGQTIAVNVAPSVPEQPPSEISAQRTTTPKRPEVGSDFLGFRLVDELGTGAFGRVFLAWQGNLAGRPVALKVGPGLFPESQTLAQLQHTNIVPIHSLHESAGLQAVCMPFFGRTTLAHVLKDLRGHPTWPASGQVLLSTLQQHSSITQTDSRTNAQAEPIATPPSSVSTESAVLSLLKRMSYPNAVVWIGTQLAAGLAHAHGRGILHRDLKPANVLLTDDGVPMLLDFNLAQDTKVRPDLVRASMGGTLPYMAPEQLSAFSRQGGQLDARSDIYSLGVVLYEMISGRRPFREPDKGPLLEVVNRLIEDRRQQPESVRSTNAAVSRSVDAIIGKCLAPKPENRYQSAADLQEDFERHLANLPLRHAPEPFGRERVRKWAARHPRVSSSGSVAVAAVLLLAFVATGGYYARERSRGYEARAVLGEHRSEFRTLQADLDDRNRSLSRPEQGIDRCRALLERYGISSDVADTSWEQGKLVRYLSADDNENLRGDAGELFYLMARLAAVRAEQTADPSSRTDLVRQAEQWNAAAEHYVGNRLPRALILQQADLARLRGDAAAEQVIRKKSDATAPGTARDHYLLGAWYAQRGRHRDALPLLRQATQMDPESLPAWFVRGTCHLAIEQPELAALCFGSCVAVDKNFAPAWLNRGMAYNRLRFFDQACDDYERALQLDPTLTEARIQRASAREGLRDLPGAIADLTAALDAGAAPSRIYFIRARLRAEAGDEKGATLDRAEGMRLTPADELSWVARAEARMGTEPEAALADVAEALRLNPASMTGLQLQAHLLAERLGRPTDAVKTLDRAVELYPEYAPAVAGRGVLLARTGRRTDAVRDAEAALMRDGKAPNLYQVGCIYALTAKGEPSDKAKAFELLWAALRTGFGLDIVDTDTDLDPIRSEPEFRRLVSMAKARQAELTR
ncbi:MAG TPA: protein kinase [Gemmataceae bacterium]|jgi:serine/threonine protein kinase/tetratricopeptide (TPR) repeat protein|nr:protein kinase [Gemmataceae bacterium]